MINVANENKNIWDALRKSGLKKKSDNYDNWKTTNPEEERWGKAEAEKEKIQQGIINRINQLETYKNLLAHGKVKSIEATLEETIRHKQDDEPGDFYYRFINDIEETLTNLEQLFKEVESAVHGFPLTWDHVRESHEPPEPDRDDERHWN